MSKGMMQEGFMFHSSSPSANIGWLRLCHGRTWQKLAVSPFTGTGVAFALSTTLAVATPWQKLAFALTKSW